VPRRRRRGRGPERGGDEVACGLEGPASLVEAAGDAGERVRVGDADGGAAEDEVEVGQGDGEAAAAVGCEVARLSGLRAADEVEGAGEPVSDDACRVWASVGAGCGEPAGGAAAAAGRPQLVELGDGARPRDLVAAVGVEVDRSVGMPSLKRSKVGALSSVLLNLAGCESRGDLSGA
jgi:hypothetical protein